MAQPNPSLLELLMKRDGFVVERRGREHFTMCFSRQCIKERKAGRIWHGTLRIERRQMGGTGHCDRCKTSVTALDYLMISPRDMIGEQDALRLIGQGTSQRKRYIAKTKPIFRFESASNPPYAQEARPTGFVPTP